MHCEPDGLERHIECTIGFAENLSDKDRAVAGRRDRRVWKTPLDCLAERAGSSSMLQASATNRPSLALFGRFSGICMLDHALYDSCDSYYIAEPNI